MLANPLFTVLDLDHLYQLCSIR